MAIKNRFSPHLVSSSSMQLLLLYSEKDFSYLRLDQLSDPFPQYNSFLMDGRKPSAGDKNLLPNLAVLEKNSSRIKIKKCLTIWLCRIMFFLLKIVGNNHTPNVFILTKLFSKHSEVLLIRKTEFSKALTYWIWAYYWPLKPSSPPKLSFFIVIVQPQILLTQLRKGTFLQLILKKKSEILKKLTAKVHIKASKATSNKQKLNLPWRRRKK